MIVTCDSSLACAVFDARERVDVPAALALARGYPLAAVLDVFALDGARRTVYLSTWRVHDGVRLRP